MRYVIYDPVSDSIFVTIDIKSLLLYNIDGVYPYIFNVIQHNDEHDDKKINIIHITDTIHENMLYKIYKIANIQQINHIFINVGVFNDLKDLNSIMNIDDFANIFDKCNDYIISLFITLSAIYDTILRCYSNEDLTIDNIPQLIENASQYSSLKDTEELKNELECIILNSNKYKYPEFNEMLNRANKDLEKYKTLQCYNDVTRCFDKLMSLIENYYNCSHNSDINTVVYADIIAFLLLDLGVLLCCPLSIDDIYSYFYEEKDIYPVELDSKIKFIFDMYFK